MANTTVVWGPDDRRRAQLEAELRRIVAALPGLGVKKAIVFDETDARRALSLAGDVIRVVGEKLSAKGS
jgi:hypothetical protein